MRFELSMNLDLLFTLVTPNFNNLQNVHKDSFLVNNKENRLSALSFRLAACIRAVPTGRIFVKFDNGEFHEILSMNSKSG